MEAEASQGQMPRSEEEGQLPQADVTAAIVLRHLNGDVGLTAPGRYAMLVDYVRHCLPLAIYVTDVRDRLRQAHEKDGQ